jgi:hypothetical protein
MAAWSTAVPFAVRGVDDGKVGVDQHRVAVLPVLRPRPVCQVEARAAGHHGSRGRQRGRRGDPVAQIGSPEHVQVQHPVKTAALQKIGLAFRRGGSILGQQAAFGVEHRQPHAKGLRVADQAEIGRTRIVQDQQVRTHQCQIEALRVERHQHNLMAALRQQMRQQDKAMQVTHGMVDHEADPV